MTQPKKFIAYPRYLFRKQQALKLLQRHAPPPQRFLEIGCGAGDFGITLATRGYSGTMIDFSAEAVSMTKRGLSTAAVAEKVTCLQYDVYDLKPDTHQFDCIIIFEVLEHVEDDDKMLQHLRSLLRPGGILLFSVPARMKLWGYDDVRAGHFRRYEKKALRKQLDQHGYRVMKLYSYGFPFMNLLKPLRIAAFRLKRSQLRDGDKSALTKKSGVNIVRLPAVSYLINKYTLYPFIQISRVFNNLDRGEGYLCLATKK